MVGLLGPNGAGKTTSFNMVVGLVVPEAGRVLLGDVDLTRLPMHRRARLGVGYLPQEASIFRQLTVRQNFTGVLEALGVGRREREERAPRAPRRVPPREGGGVSLGEQLSGGERRRAEVARSLLSSPRYILFDEPFAGVDPIAVGELQRLIGGLRDRGIGVLITDHAVREALGICGRAYILSAGSILEAGTPAEIAACAAGARRLPRREVPAGRRPRAAMELTDGLELKQHLKMTQQLVMTPQLQQAIKLLQLSRMELVDLIRTEVTENPLLEGADEPEEEPRPERRQPGRGQPTTTRSPSTRRPRRREEVKGEEGANEIDWDQYLDHYQLQGHTAPSNRNIADEELPGFEATLTRKTDLVDHLVWQLRLSNFTPEEEQVAMLIIGNLDEDGYFKMPRGRGGGRRTRRPRDPLMRVSFEAGVGVEFAEDGAEAGPAARPGGRRRPRPARVPADPGPAS